MKYLKRYNESNNTDTSSIIGDILSDLSDMGAECRTETYWIDKDYKPGEPFQTVSKIEFGGAIRLYWTELMLSFERPDFDFIIEVMKEMNEVRSKLKSLGDDVYIDWRVAETNNSGQEVEYEGTGKKSLVFKIFLKKHDEVSTKDPQGDLVKLIKPFCDKNGYRISVSKSYPDIVNIRIDDAISPRGSEYDSYVEKRYKLAQDIYNVVYKLSDGKVKIREWVPNRHFFNLETIQIGLAQ